MREDNRGCCGQKIKEFLLSDYNKDLSHTTIYKVLREKYKLRSKWKKYKIRGLVPKAYKPREVIQMDSVDFGEIYAFTGVDIFTKEAEVRLFPNLTAKDGLSFLEYSFKRTYKHSDLIQTDGGSEFKAEFRQNVFKYADKHRYSRPYKKNEQSYIESFNRSLRKECLGWGKYKELDIPSLTEEINSYLVWYHDKRPHMGLDMKTPNSFIKSLPDI